MGQYVSKHGTLAYRLGTWLISFTPWAFLGLLSTDKRAVPCMIVFVIIVAMFSLYRFISVGREASKMLATRKCLWYRTQQSNDATPCWHTAIVLGMSVCDSVVLLTICFVFLFALARKRSTPALLSLLW